MKKFIKTLFALTLSITLVSSLFVFSASAAASTGISLSNSKPKVGDKVTVTVSVKADEAIYSLEGNLTYNASVLKYISGASAASGSTLRFVDSFEGNKTVTYKVVFETIAEGSGSLSFSAKYVGISFTKISASGSSATITVKNPVIPEYVKSSNANLSSLSVSGGTLSPAFSQSVTKYTATVENSAATATINASKANKNAKVSGSGVVNLQIGDNSFVITVTAEDGTKKNYYLTIKRLTVEETVSQNPLATVIGGKMYHIVSDLDNVQAPAGFALATTTYNGKEIEVFESENKKYTLYRITEDETGVTDFYVYKEYKDEFVKLPYMTVNSVMYIFADFPEGYKVPEGYFETTVTIGGNSVKAFASENTELKDFYVIYCFANGSEELFRFDMTESSIQRAPDITLFPKESAEEPAPDLEKKSFIQKIKELSLLDKILIPVSVVSVLSAIILGIALLKSKKYKKLGKFETPITDEEFSKYFSINGSNKDE